jgi:hypothetical protein
MSVAPVARAAAAPTAPVPQPTSITGKAGPDVGASTD